jgi:hypothetical protein
MYSLLYFLIISSKKILGDSYLMCLKLQQKHTHTPTSPLLFPLFHNLVVLNFGTRIKSIKKICYSLVNNVILNGRFYVDVFNNATK